jgi:RNA polymerase sigma-70 factor (ECF subfamily)
MTDGDAVEWFTGLYDSYQWRVYAYAVSRAGRQLADEVVSEVFLVAWRKLAEVPDDPLPWLLVVARNVIGSEFRASARQQSLAAELRSWTSEAAADIADQVSERHAVLRALAALSDADREILTLVAWHGLPPHEAARVAGCSTAAYFVRLHRARRRLEHAMSADPEVSCPADGAAAPSRSTAAASALRHPGAGQGERQSR